MTRLNKVLMMLGLASVYLMQGTCTFGNGGATGGFSLIPNVSSDGLIPFLLGGGFGLTT